MGGRRGVSAESEVLGGPPSGSAGESVHTKNEQQWIKAEAHTKSFLRKERTRSTAASLQTGERRRAHTRPSCDLRAASRASAQRSHTPCGTGSLRIRQSKNELALARV